MTEIYKIYSFPGGQRLEIVQGDLTRQAVDAIVNAANSRLAHGGGVAGVISQRGGPVIQRQSTAWVQEHGPVLHERPAYTEAGNLPCRYVIHAVGPVWGAGEEEEKLASAVRGSLIVAEELGLTSVALPAIATGIFGFPKELAAGIFFKTIGAYFQQYRASTLKLVRLTLRDQPTLAVFLSAFDERQKSQ